jgi:hypothetical protein
MLPGGARVRVNAAKYPDAAAACPGFGRVIEQESGFPPSVLVKWDSGDSITVNNPFFLEVVTEVEGK